MTTKSATLINGIPLSNLTHSDLRREAGKAARSWLVSRAIDEADVPLDLDDALETFDGLGDSANDADIAAVAFRIDGQPGAEALIVERRIGIAWGADAAWGDLDLRDPVSGEHWLLMDSWLHPDVTAAINDWLNDAEAWEARA